MTEFLSLLVTGVVTGSIYAVTASGLVVTYNATGVFNFAHGAVGMFLAYLYWQLWQGWGWDPLLSLVIVLLVVAPLFALGVERVLMRPLYGSSLNTMIVVTLGMFLILYGLTSTIWNQTVVRNLPSWFASDQVDVLNVNLTYEQLITIGCAVGVAVGLWVLFKRTRLGVSMRAVVDDPALASMTGARSSRISGFAWMIGFMLAGLAGILLAPGTGMSIQILSELVIFGYAAAIVGRLRSLPLTFLGAMILGVGESMAVGYVPSSALNDVTAVLPMGLLIIALLILPQAKLSVGRVVRLRAPRVPSLTTTLVSGVVLVGVSALLSSLITGNNLYTLGLALAIGLAALLARAPLGVRRPGVAVPVHLHRTGVLGHEQGRRRELHPRRPGRHRAVRRGRRVAGPPRAAAARPVHGPGHPGLRRPDGQHLLHQPVGGQRWVDHRRSSGHLRPALRLGPVVHHAPRHRVRPLPHRRGGVAARAVRAPAGGHERQPGRMCHRGDEHHQHQVGRLRPRWGTGRAWPAPSTAACPGRYRCPSSTSSTRWCCSWPWSWPGSPS